MTTKENRGKKEYLLDAIMYGLFTMVFLISFTIVHLLIT